jgi:hypothetical protein
LPSPKLTLCVEDQLNLVRVRINSTIVESSARVKYREKVRGVH